MGGSNNDLFSEDRLGRTKHVGENIDREGGPPLPQGEPIWDYDVPSDIKSIDRTQDSTARTTFPMVSSSSTNYMLCSHIDSELENDLDGSSRRCNNSDSSDAKWLPEFRDTIESEDSNFNVDIMDDNVPVAPRLYDWCMRPESFTPTHFDVEQLAQHYRNVSWNSAGVDFVTNRDNFTGPTLGLCLASTRVMQHWIELY